MLRCKRLRTKRCQNPRTRGSAWVRSRRTKLSPNVGSKTRPLQAHPGEKDHGGWDWSRQPHRSISWNHVSAESGKRHLSTSVLTAARLGSRVTLCPSAKGQSPANALRRSLCHWAAVVVGEPLSQVWLCSIALERGRCTVKAPCSRPSYRPVAGLVAKRADFGILVILCRWLRTRRRRKRPRTGHVGQAQACSRS